MTFWQIVPENDGYTYLSRDDIGNHFLLKKEVTKWNLGRLAFSSEESVLKYLQANKLEGYRPEPFEVNECFFRNWRNDYEED